jgi:hypothetical protein
LAWLIQALEAQGVQRDREIADLSGRLSPLAATLEAIRAGAPGARVPAPAPAVPAIEERRSKISMLKKRLRMALPPPPTGFASLILAEFPALFAGFGGKRFTLLWGGSRDGFGAGDFHGRCDGHGNTLTLIEDTAGNIFGGFTPLKWHSISKFQVDPGLKSFLFTLKNPHNLPARQFVLRARRNHLAIAISSSCGPHFQDICVRDNCNANTDSWTADFGHSYRNDTALDEDTLFTGSPNFTVKEIEVFEITD